MDATVLRTWRENKKADPPTESGLRLGKIVTADGHHAFT